MPSQPMHRREFLEKGAAALGAAGLAAPGAFAADAPAADTSKILNYNKGMEYRRLGRTGLLVSAVCLGGHWKKLDGIIPGVFKKGGGWMEVEPSLLEPFDKNRAEILSRCIEVGMNYVDACSGHEILAYSRALKGRRDKMYFGYSWFEKEMRFKEWRTTAKLLEGLDQGMKESGLDYVDLWRITLIEKSSKHTNEEIEEAVKALDAAKKAGKARFTGFSTHDRPHIQWMIETYPKSIDVIVTPYTAKTKELPQDSVFETVVKRDVGVFGIKPFSSGSIFKGKGIPGDPAFEEDSTTARMSIRYILGNLALTAPIPGLICREQVDNMVRAIQERRELDKAELEKLEKIHEAAWANLPPDYQWLKQWEWV